MYYVNIYKRTPDTITVEYTKREKCLDCLRTIPCLLIKYAINGRNKRMNADILTNGQEPICKRCTKKYILESEKFKTYKEAKEYLRMRMMVEKL